MRSLISRQNIQIILWFSKMRTHTTNIINEVRRHIGPTNVLFNGILCRSHVNFHSTNFSSEVAKLYLLVTPIETHTLE